MPELGGWWQKQFAAKLKDPNTGLDDRKDAAR
jgi:hypothetical protein